MAEGDQEMDFFKERLFSNFKEAGLLDHMKSQMRYNILEKLQKRGISKDSDKENRNTINQAKESALNFRLLISIISEFLEYYGYNYTQAVFLPEAKHTSQTLTRSEVIDILHLNKVVNKDDPIPLLNKVVDFTDKQLDLRKERVSIQCQTDFEGRHTSLEEKLRNIDFEYLQKVDGERIVSQQSFDEKFFKFKRDYEQRMKAELAAEISRIREFELANIRLDEAEKYRTKMEQYRDELDRVYTEKLQKLREREKDTIERCKQQLKALESASYDYRQRFLKDLEMHKMKEESLDKHVTLEKESVKIQRDRLQELERDLKKQIHDLEEQKKLTIRRTDDLKSTYKSELLREAEDDRVAVIHIKGRLENETLKAEQYKSSAESYENQNKRLLEENSQITEEVRSLREARRNLELELEKNRETLQILRKAAEKDEDHIKLYDKQVNEYQAEINHQKAIAQEYKDMSQQKKREQIESNQKFIKEIEFYQTEIEKLERERESSRRRIVDLENEISSMAALIKQQTQNTDIVVQRDSVKSSHHSVQEQPRKEFHPTTSNYVFESTNRYQYSPIIEEEEEPVRRLREIDQEIRDLKEKRNKDLIEKQDFSTEKIKLKPILSHPPLYEPEGFTKDTEIRISPPHQSYSPHNSSGLSNLERKKDDLKHELQLMISSDESKFGLLNKLDRPFLNGGLKSHGQNDGGNFDNLLDRYTDKILQESNNFDDSYTKPYAGIRGLISDEKAKYNDILNSIKKNDPDTKLYGSPSRGYQESSRVQDIFKVDSPKSKLVDTYQPRLKFDEELSQRSNKSLIDSFSEENPKPIIITKKETIPSKKEVEKSPTNKISTQLPEVKIQSQAKKTETQPDPKKVESQPKKFEFESEPKKYEPLPQTKKAEPLTLNKTINMQPQSKKFEFESEHKKYEPLPQLKKIEKVEAKDDYLSSFGNKNLSRLDKPKLGAPSLPLGKTSDKSSTGLSLPEAIGTKNKQPEVLKLQETKKPEKSSNAAIDAILGNQPKSAATPVDDIDFEVSRLDEEIFDL